MKEKVGLVQVSRYDSRYAFEVSAYNYSASYFVNRALDKNFRFMAFHNQDTHYIDWCVYMAEVEQGLNPDKEWAFSVNIDLDTNVIEVYTPDTYKRIERKH